MKNITLFMALFSICAISKAQEKLTISGCFINENFETLPYVEIFYSDSVLLGETDVNGHINIELPDDVERLKIVYTGYITTEIELAPDCSNLDMILLRHHTYDFTPIRIVERKERMRLKKLPRLHKKAYKTGLFQSKNQCYRRISK